jgi:RimJ/RimL family protein N-acetyltransferase
MSATPVIRPARLTGNKLILREVETDDAGFILALRLDPKKSAYISPVQDDLARQVDWIVNYKQGGGQAYFIICDQQLNRLGTVRVYNAIGNSFSWGSWIIADGAPADAAMESALMIYHYALDHLGFRDSHFEVNRDNRSVWAFHERLFGARRVRESDEEYFFELDHDAIVAALQRYRRFLPRPLAVQLLER